MAELDYAPPPRSPRKWVILLLVWALGLIAWAAYLIAIAYFVVKVL
jgi:hypothetical protein